MTAFCFGDLRLSAFDVMRTADLLVQQQGHMFHTTYSLLWVQMLKEVYQFTVLMRSFPIAETPCAVCSRGLTGILVTPVCWNMRLIICSLTDGGGRIFYASSAESVGTDCLNAFYYGALQTAAELFAMIGDIEWANTVCTGKAVKTGAQPLLL